MIMSKYECRVDYFQNEMDYNLEGTPTLEALNAGSKALDLLQELYYKFEQDRGLQSSYLSLQIRELLKEWN